MDGEWGAESWTPPGQPCLPSLPSAQQLAPRPCVCLSVALSHPLQKPSPDPEAAAGLTLSQLLPSFAILPAEA